MQNVIVFLSGALSALFLFWAIVQLLNARQAIRDTERRA